MPKEFFLTMIRSSFIFLDKVGLKKEAQIWQQGIETWQDFLNTSVRGISKASKERHDQKVRLARINLDYGNAPFFKELLPKSEMWRIYPEFKEQAAYLDIETSGWNITVVGIYDGYEMKHFIRGINLNRENVLREIYKHKILLTFNGSSFDIPMLNRCFRHEIRLPQIDLRHVCGRIGLKGGLKSIEKQINIKREEAVQSMIGAEAAYCWGMWMHTGRKEYLNLLLQYNAEDCINLQALAEHSTCALWKKIKPKGL